MFERNFFFRPSYLNQLAFRIFQKPFLLKLSQKKVIVKLYFYTVLLKNKLKENPAKMESQVRQNYHRDCEAAINKMINMELYASYTYTSMVSK